LSLFHASGDVMFDAELTRGVMRLLVSVSVPAKVASVPVVGSVIAVVPETVSVVPKLPEIVSVLAALFATPRPPCAGVMTAALVRIIASEFGRVNVLSADAGPVNLVNPFPVPP
jgi:hypothetical protein